MQQIVKKNSVVMSVRKCGRRDTDMVAILRGVVMPFLLKHNLKFCMASFAFFITNLALGQAGFHVISYYLTWFFLYPSIALCMIPFVYSMYVRNKYKTG